MDFSNTKLLWSEGTMLAQQHFQQWDRLHKSRDRFWYHFNKKRPRSGFLNLEIEMSVLEFGIFRLNYFNAILFDGQVIESQSNQKNKSPLELDLNATEYLREPNQGDILTVYLAVPKGSNSYGVSGYPKKSFKETRWIAEYKSCSDEMDENRQHEVLVGHLNVQLLVNNSIDFDKRKTENDLLAVAQIVFSGRSQYVFKSEFVPSIIWISASQWFIDELKSMESYLQSIEKLLILKIRNITEIKSDSSAINPVYEWRVRELLKIISIFSYHIKSWVNNPNVDPDEVIDTIEQLLVMARSISTYQYMLKTSITCKANNLYQSFNAVLDSFKGLVKDIFPIRQKNIPLNKGEDVWFLSESLDEEMMQMADLYLSVSFGVDKNLSDRFSKEVKLSGIKDIQCIITQALSGIAVTYDSGNFGFLEEIKNKTYFKINKLGPYWENVKESRKICVFTSKYFSKFDLNLLAIFKD
jgi:type VI secretion system protein ImpJ